MNGVSPARWNRVHLYEDSFSVWRAVERDGGQCYLPVAALTELPCRLSVRGRSTLGSTGRQDSPKDSRSDRNPVEQLHQLFCDNAHALRAGDVVRVTHGGVSTEYVAGTPCRYPFFQQLLLYQREEA